jgi:hypothetical protein
MYRGFYTYVEHPTSEAGGKMSFEDARAAASRKHDEKEAVRLMEGLPGTPTESVSFRQLSGLRRASREEAERCRAAVDEEAQREFATGHFAAELFDSVPSPRSLYRRAEFLAVRDTFIAEYKPEGGIEFALTDMLAQTFFLPRRWMEVAVRRTKRDARRESEECTSWNQSD